MVVLGTQSLSLLFCFSVLGIQARAVLWQTSALPLGLHLRIKHHLLSDFTCYRTVWKEGTGHLISLCFKHSVYISLDLQGANKPELAIFSQTFMNHSVKKDVTQYPRWIFLIRSPNRRAVARDQQRVWHLESHSALQMSWVTPGCHLFAASGSYFLILKNVAKGGRDGSFSKMLMEQAWGSEFNAQNPCEKAGHGRMWLWSQLKQR